MQINQFIFWYYNEFQTTKLYTDMAGMAENSPWHRERTIGAHTDMVVTEYLRRIGGDLVVNGNDILGAFAAAFHDVGKPNSFQEKHTDERGDYLSFGGHELVSARLWEDYASTNFDMLAEKFEFSQYDITRVGLLIEHHKPWDVKKDDKLNNMATTMIIFDIDDVFINLVLADTWGRMSDDQEQKRSNVDEWTTSFNNRVVGIMDSNSYDTILNLEKKPVFHVPIGVSGTGKTTLYNKTPDVNVAFSLDSMRTELYGDDYAVAFAESCEDNQFKNTANARFIEMVKEGKDMFLDNTNTSRKTRRFFLAEARRKGYHLCAYVMPTALATVINRQQSRTDKTVPAGAVTNQYMHLQLPQFGEFDEIVVLDSNL